MLIPQHLSEPVTAHCAMEFLYAVRKPRILAVRHVSELGNYHEHHNGVIPY